MITITTTTTTSTIKETAIVAAVARTTTQNLTPTENRLYFLLNILRWIKVTCIFLSSNVVASQPGLGT